MGVSEIRGILFRGPYNKDLYYTIFGSPIFGNSHITTSCTALKTPDSTYYLMRPLCSASTLSKAPHGGLGNRRHPRKRRELGAGFAWRVWV